MHISIEPCRLFALPSHKVSSARDREQNVYVSSEGQNRTFGGCGVLAVRSPKLYKPPTGLLAAVTTPMTAFELHVA